MSTAIAGTANAFAPAQQQKPAVTFIATSSAGQRFLPSVSSPSRRFHSPLTPPWKRQSAYSGRTSLSLGFSWTLPLCIPQVIHNVVAHGLTTFASNWKSYSLIPVIAAFVGWFTNYLAVQMIFYPIKWRGIPIWRGSPNQPLGLIGWQGIVPTKTEKMSAAMVQATLTQLLSMEEVVRRLDPNIVATLLLPNSRAMIQPVLEDVVDSFAGPKKFVLQTVLYSTQKQHEYQMWQQDLARQFLTRLTIGFQTNINRLLNLKHCVVEQMLEDRSLLGKLFQLAGRKELTFLTESGLWFGFLLGIIQLIVALYWSNPWTLSVGGLIVGLATNWLALKWIFEPVQPTRIGPFVLQGLFLRRQADVSADFANFFASRILRSRKLFKSVLTDPTTAPRFATLFANQFGELLHTQSKGLVELDRTVIQAASMRATNRLYPYLESVHDYVDEKLNIEETLRTRMMAMTSQQFERVLHPIFEEDELTLILAGGGLGFAAGLIQQGFTTGSLVLPKLVQLKGMLVPTAVAVGTGALVYAAIKVGQSLKLTTFPRRLLKRIRDPKTAFLAMDVDRDGFVSFQELSNVSIALGFTSSHHDLEKVFDELDKYRNGRVSLEDFEDWWNRDLGNKFHKKLAKELGVSTVP